MSLLLLFNGGQGNPPNTGGSGAYAGGGGGIAAGGPGGTAGGGIRGARGSARAAAGGQASAAGFQFQTALGRAYAGGGASARASASGHVGTGLGAIAAAGASARSSARSSRPSSGQRAVGGFSIRVKGKAYRIGLPPFMLTRLELDLFPNRIIFTRIGDPGPFPMLSFIGSLRLAARAGQISGIGVNESTSVTVQLDNSQGQAVAIIGRPLRVAGRIYDGEDLFFSGNVARIDYGQAINITIEA